MDAGPPARERALIVVLGRPPSMGGSLPIVRGALAGLLHAAPGPAAPLHVLRRRPFPSLLVAPIRRAALAVLVLVLAFPRRPFLHGCSPGELRLPARASGSHAAVSFGVLARAPNRLVPRRSAGTRKDLGPPQIPQTSLERRRFLEEPDLQ